MKLNHVFSFFYSMVPFLKIGEIVPNVTRKLRKKGLKDPTRVFGFGSRECPKLETYIFWLIKNG